MTSLTSLSSTPESSTSSSPSSLVMAWVAGSDMPCGAQWGRWGHDLLPLAVTRG